MMISWQFFLGVIIANNGTILLFSAGSSNTIVTSTNVVASLVNVATSVGIKYYICSSLVNVYYTFTAFSDVAAIVGSAKWLFIFLTTFTGVVPWKTLLYWHTEIRAIVET